MSEKFEISLKNGTHHELNRLDGEWRGVSRVWFEPNILADESACMGTIRSVLNGMFIIHEYRTSLQGKPVEGIAIIGHSLGENKYQSAWIDSFHNGTAIMFSENNKPQMPFSVLATYGDVPKWGWRTKIEIHNNDKFTITMFNIAPEGKDEKAVEVEYERLK